MFRPPQRYSNLAKVVIASSCVATSCTFVEPKPGSAEVRIISSEIASQCEYTGRVTAQVLDEVLFVDRSETAMSKNLDTLAKNEAIRLGGNAAMAIGEIDNGRRDYNIYNCMK